MVLFLCCPGYGVLQINYSMGRIFLLLVFHQKPQSIEIPQNWELIFLIWCVTLIKRRHLLLTDALGTTDRRLPKLSWRNSRLSFGDRGGYFCVFPISLPREYPIPKQVRPKPNTVISSIISMAQPSFPRFPNGFLCKRRVTVPPKRANRLPSW